MSFSNFIVFQLGEIYHFPKQGFFPLFHRGMVEGLTPSEVLELRSEGAAPEDAVAMDRKISSTLKRVSLVKKDRFAQSGFGFFFVGKIHVHHVLHKLLIHILPFFCIDLLVCLFFLLPGKLNTENLCVSMADFDAAISRGLADSVETWMGDIGNFLL